ncbi:hypothetical protein [Peribacillus kribbensis]|uniref:hypothetical protein n=1 Tax=Peribacillus kribbensis TaxID=356658 RepID=UPI0003F4ADC2|nr:hypothetical protein [Peribacillus kribbensis]
MIKKVWIGSLCLVIIAAIYFLVISPDHPNLAGSPSTAALPQTSLEEGICRKLAASNGHCKRVFVYDADSRLAFAENSSGIVPMLTNNQFTKVKKILPALNFQEFREEKSGTGPITWRVENTIQKGYSLLYGFSRDEAKTIIINSEGNIQPNRFYVRDDLAGKGSGTGTAPLSVWYAALPKEKIKLPLKISVYNAKGQLINGGNE